MVLKRRNFLLFLGASVGYEVQDDLVLPEGFANDVIAGWGNRVGDSRFGYNNDYPCLKKPRLLPLLFQLSLAGGCIGDSGC